MMVEDYCSFETALALKEKGFDAEIKTYWCKGTHDEPIFEFIPNARNHDISNSEGYIHFNGHQSELEDEPVCIAPTLQMAMKWLREKYRLHCDINCDIVLDWFYQIKSLNETVEYDYKEYKIFHNEDGKLFMTYEEAAEQAIKYCLEHLI